MTPGEAFEEASASGNQFDEKISRGRSLEEYLGMIPWEAFEEALWPGSLGKLHDQNDGEQ